VEALTSLATDSSTFVNPFVPFLVHSDRQHEYKESDQVDPD